MSLKYEPVSGEGSALHQGKGECHSRSAPDAEHRRVPGEGKLRGRGGVTIHATPSACQQSSERKQNAFEQSTQLVAGVAPSRGAQGGGGG